MSPHRQLRPSTYGASPERIARAQLTIFPCLFDADMLGVGRAWARLGFLGVLVGRRGADRATWWTSR